MPRPSDYLLIVAPTFKTKPESYEPQSVGLITSLTEPMPHNLHMITARSPRRYKRAVETLAWYFKREFRFDFVGYTAGEVTSDQEVRSFFWTEDDDRSGHRVTGACTFRKQEWTNLPEGYWTLCWIWMHPFRRGQGQLNRAWPFFTEMFEPLSIEYPISDPMKKFLADKPHRVVHTTDKGQAVELYVKPVKEVLDLSVIHDPGRETK